ISRNIAASGRRQAVSHRVASTRITGSDEPARPTGLEHEEIQQDDDGDGDAQQPEQNALHGSSVPSIDPVTRQNLKSLRAKPGLGPPVLTSGLKYSICSCCLGPKLNP